MCDGTRQAAHCGKLFFLKKVLPCFCEFLRIARQAEFLLLQPTHQQPHNHPNDREDYGNSACFNIFIELLPRVDSIVFPYPVEVEGIGDSYDNHSSKKRKSESCFQDRDDHQGKNTGCLHDWSRLPEG